MKRFEVRIESVAFKGYGVAHLQGKVVFIPQTVTGDRAWIEVTEEKKNYSMGRLIQILAPSPWRVTPPCLWFGGCGGCHWQHIDYSIQCNLKREILEDLLRRIGRVKAIPSPSVIPSPHPYGYRVRVQLKASKERLGYFQERSHRVVDIQACPIAHPLINQALSLIRKRFLPLSKIKEVEINVSPDEDRGVLLFPDLFLNAEIEDLLKEILNTHSIIKGIGVGQKNGFHFWGDSTLNFRIPIDSEKEDRTLTLRVSPGSFSQVNPIQNQRLIRTILQWVEVDKVENALDLYCGIGNFTLPLASRGLKKVWGVEENRMAIQDARFNAERNGIKNCEFIQGRVEEILTNWNRGNPTLVVIDPPRRGCMGVLNQLIRLKPQKVIYISCEPTTFARDIRLFTERGYCLQRVELIDMFPQTYHIEMVGLLELQ